MCVSPPHIIADYHSGRAGHVCILRLYLYLYFYLYFCLNLNLYLYLEREENVRCVFVSPPRPIADHSGRAGSVCIPRRLNTHTHKHNFALLHKFTQFFMTCFAIPAG